MNVLYVSKLFGISRINIKLFIKSYFDVIVRKHVDLYLRLGSRWANDDLIAVFKNVINNVRGLKTGFFRPFLNNVLDNSRKIISGLDNLYAAY